MPKLTFQCSRFPNVLMKADISLSGEIDEIKDAYEALVFINQNEASKLTVINLLLFSATIDRDVIVQTLRKHLERCMKTKRTWKLHFLANSLFTLVPNLTITSNLSEDMRQTRKDHAKTLLIQLEKELKTCLVTHKRLEVFKMLMLIVGSCLAIVTLYNILYLILSWIENVI